ncbi:hypothetical protein [Amycolatopsis thermophila]|uniref:Uncharacterized protein n=1 Tax=Amycolatopsis thermophila TaxID=206084 RepID=A0ABU0EWP2_9PSEU|nr:hypothetical protein [Amycolatopsis thermophila]MDQ0379691.1 hypothetical protein [Amycolatopsis thermophila]
MLKLVASDPRLVLDENQVRRLRYWILEILPSSDYLIEPGPGAVITAYDRTPDELAPALRAKFEEIAGCHWLDAP